MPIRSLSAVGLLVLVAGCTATGNDETDHLANSENAINAMVGDVRVDDAYVITGSSPRLHVSLLNQGSEEDSLAQLMTSTGAVDVPGLPVALVPGELVDFDEHDGSALALPVATPTAGNTLQVGLRFDRVGTLWLQLPVVAP